MNKTYTPVIGLEVHVELKTQSKMFCGCSADHFGKDPNTQTCPVCLGLPGALPVPNKKALEWCIKLGLALNCTVPDESKFDRKHYFYPDLPKGYQISQYDKPLCVNGRIDIRGREVRINRVHQEEDTGKLQHVRVAGERVTLVDFNRSGVALVEVVTEPDFHSVEEVDLYVKKLQRIIRYLCISNADMEKGSMRLEPSISLQRSGTSLLPTYRVELKNINSFRFLRKAIEHEVHRQTELLDKGVTPVQQTRGWNEKTSTTLLQREKEQSHDYRYFPEPDIPPMHFSKECVESIRKQIPELPDEKKIRFMKIYHLSDVSAELLIQAKELADYFEKAVALSQMSPTLIANALINQPVDIDRIKPSDLVEMIEKKLKGKKVDTETLTVAIHTVLKANQKVIDDYNKGKTAALMFLVGMVKRELKGKGDAQKIKELLEGKIHG